MSSTSVAIVCPGMANGAAGGVESVAMWLRQGLAATKEFQPSVVSMATSMRDPDSVRLLEPRTWTTRPSMSCHQIFGVPLVHFGANASEFEVFRCLPRRALTDHLRQFDIIQVVSGTPAFGAAVLPADRPTLLQAATTVTSERAYGSPSGVLGLYRRASTRAMSRLEAKALSAAQHVFVENQWMYEECLPHSLGRLSLAPPGIDDEWFVPPDAPPVDSDYILAVGRFTSPRKNFVGLLRAFSSAVMNHGLELRLVIAGGGPVPQYLVDLARELDILSRVTFEPNVSKLDLLKLYQNARLFALASLEEGLGLVYLEAQACGVPVVSLENAGAREVFRRGAVGSLVPAEGDQSSNLAVALAKWADAAADLSARFAARAMVEREFSNAMALDRFTTVYRSVLRAS